MEGPWRSVHDSSVAWRRGHLPSRSAGQARKLGSFHGNGGGGCGGRGGECGGDSTKCGNSRRCDAAPDGRRPGSAQGIKNAIDPRRGSFLGGGHSGGCGCCRAGGVRPCGASCKYDAWWSNSGAASGRRHERPSAGDGGTRGASGTAGNGRPSGQEYSTRRERRGPRRRRSWRLGDRWRTFVAFIR